MIKNKRGISGVIVALILVLLALVAAGIIWYVVRSIAEGGAEDIQLRARCFDVEMSPTQVSSCTAGICNVTIERTDASDEEITKVRLVFTTDDGTQNYPVDQDVSITALGLETITDIDTGLADVGKVEVAFYLEDDAGEQQLCSGTTSLNL